MTSCKLWIRNADWHTTVRADRVLALRVTVQPGAAGRKLAQLIARHIDDPEGGIIDCSHEGTADTMFEFRSFTEHSGPRRLR